MVVVASPGDRVLTLKSDNKFGVEKQKYNQGTMANMKD